MKDVDAEISLNIKTPICPPKKATLECHSHILNVTKAAFIFFFLKTYPTRDNFQLLLNLVGCNLCPKSDPVTCLQLAN